MPMIATTATRPTTLPKPMPHRRPREKLGGSWRSADMLFPAAAVHDAQRQEQEQERQGHKRNNRPRVQDATGKILHLVRNGEAVQQVAEAAEFSAQFIDGISEDEQREVEPQR